MGLPRGTETNATDRAVESSSFVGRGVGTGNLLVECEFRLQDPTASETIYLFEALVEAMATATSGRAVFAFVTEGALKALLADPGVNEFVSQRPFSLVVGLDAITTRPTLERLLEIEAQSAHFSVRVFWNTTDGLFHPKIAHFRRRNGSQILIVGSGNLTPGGLRRNIEAYSVLRASPRDRLNLSEWDAFLQQHNVDIRAIDDEALARAARNIIRGGRRRREAEPDVAPAEAPEADADNDRVLIAQVPAAGGRWHQVHFNEAVVDEFFRVEPNTAQRVFLRQRTPEGALLELEPPRPLVLSGTNLNRKIELGARAGEEYPTDGRPIAVFRERGLREFYYMMLMPGEEGYAQLRALTQQLPQVGSGVPRVLTNGAALRAAWPTCPLLLPDPEAA